MWCSEGLYFPCCVLSAAITHKNQIPHWLSHHQSAVAINLNFATYASMPSFMFISLHIFSEILTSKNEIPLLGPFWIAFPFQEDHYTCLLKIPSANGQRAIQHSPNFTKIFNSHLNFLADFKESCEAASVWLHSQTGPGMRLCCLPCWNCFCYASDLQQLWNSPRNSKVQGGVSSGELGLLLLVCLKLSPVKERCIPVLFESSGNV